jgi:hypothetical protein
MFCEKISVFWNRGCAFFGEDDYTCPLVHAESATNFVKGFAAVGFGQIFVRKFFNLL